ncbi:MULTISPECIES: AMP-binding protein [unclassified Achromobacter]|uniref:AMP-binding protein n=1 Tax=unclassified Achromobacter TaxID=2626865 RepID=UPI000B5192B6|nr:MULTISPECIES: AMP-binding protein [unclassified Achromobacter]OWT68922.1 AMP-dependent synthetase [Achromobacter sp. HZ28]OWT78515.1 AMP-dependent synthetase [Achromobacter sp. HZ34]
MHPHPHPYTRYFPARHDDDALDVVAILRHGLSTDPARPLFSFDGDGWQAGRVRAQVARTQAALRGLGIRAGDRVAVMLDNSPEHMALIYALMLMGAVWVPVNTKLKTPGIDYLIQHCKPVLFIAGQSYLEYARAAHQAAGATRLVPEEDLWTETAAPPGHIHGADGSPPADAPRDTGDLLLAPVKPEDLLCIIYTSGTTGAPKGVLFTHRMMRIASESALVVADVRDGDRLFLWEPLCHIGGAQMLLAPFLARTVLSAVPRFSASRFWEQIAQERCTQLHYLGGILDILMRQLGETPAPAHTLRLGWGAGVSRQNWRTVRERLGIALRECYGMTEGSSFATVNTDDLPGSIGKALPWLNIELLDEQDRPVPVGELGQIVVSSAIPGTFFSGYLDNPSATAEALRGGKLYTGDIARADRDGHLYFVGRRTDSMRIRGENVSAWEVERVVLSHPDVAAAAAIGVASDIGEQEILLYVQWRVEHGGSFEPLSRWLGEHLASYQWPRYYAAVAQFELTPSERIRKHQLSRAVDQAWDRQRR